MKQRLILVFLGLFIIAGVVGGVVYFEWPGKSIVPGLPKAGPPQAESATSTLGELVVQPLTITAQTPTRIVADIHIPDPNLIPQSVNLQRLDASGKVTGILGTLRDNGQGGDLAAGDKRFSLEFTLTEPGPGPIRLRASAAFRGVLTRLFSSEKRIQILEPVPDTGPEVLIQRVGTTFVLARDVTEIRPFFDEASYQRIVSSVGRGVPLVSFGRMFETAVLEWKTTDAAQFRVFIERGGERFGTTVKVRKFADGWKIVD